MGDYRVALSVSFYPRRIEEAKHLVCLADQHPEQRVFPALASVLFAVALEDAIRSMIAERCANAAAAGVLAHPFDSIRNDSLRHRMQALATIVGRGFFTVSGHRAQAAALHSLVFLRNRLLHVDEFVRELDEHDDAVTVMEDKLHVKIQMPQDPWSAIGNDHAKHFGEAVECYLQEVINPLSDMSKYWITAV